MYVKVPEPIVVPELDSQYRTTLSSWVKLHSNVQNGVLVDLLKTKYQLSYARAWEQVSAWRMEVRLHRELAANLTTKGANNNG